MDLKIAKERILVIKDQISQEQAEEKAIAKKVDAFGTLNKLAGLFSKPDPNDFEIVYREHRYQPFWHISSQAHYVYDRSSNYQIEVKHSEVKKVTVEGKDYEVNNAHLHIPVMEHCAQDLSEEVLIDGISGSKNKSLKEYINKDITLVEGDKLNDVTGKEAVVVPPQTRVSGIIREMLAQMIKGIEADTIFEENIEICTIDLYYRPVFSFQFLWKSKNKKAILDIDAITGETQAGTRTFNEFAGQVLDRDFLFDIGADFTGMFIPGGSIAIKAAKKFIDSNKK